MNKCECYRIRTERRYFSDYEKGYAAAQGKLPQTMKTSVRVLAWVPKRSIIAAAMETGLNAIFTKMCVRRHEPKPGVQMRPRNEHLKRSRI